MIDVIILGAFAFLIVVNLSKLPKWWRGDFHLPDHAILKGPGGRAILRDLGVVTILGLQLLLFMGILSLFPEGPKDRFGFVRPAWVVMPFLVTFFVTFACAISIMLFNRPKKLVPPHLRDQPGLVRDSIDRDRRGSGS